MSDGDWLKKGLPASAMAGSEVAKPRPKITRPLMPQEIEACEAILAGDTPRVAYRRETGRKGGQSFDRFMRNGETQAYLAARRMELRLKLMGEEVDPAAEWLSHVRNQAYWDPIDLAVEPPKKMEDIAKLPEHVRKMISGYKYDRFGNFILIFVDKKASQDMFARYFGLYQEDRRNEGDTAADLLNNVFWRFIMNLHLQQGMSIQEAHVLARREPETVKAWGQKHNLLPAGEEEIEVVPAVVVDDGGDDD